ncbi:MAG: M28 family metallopeptidase [Phycisphaerales bacterium]
MPSTTRRDRTHTLTRSALALLVAAGGLCSIGAGLSGCAPKSATSAKASSTTTTATPPAAPASLEGPGSYAVIDGKKEPVPVVAMGDKATVARIVAEGKDRNKVMEHLAHLSSNIGTRLTGSTNLETANKWTRDQFEAWGLSIAPFSGADSQTTSDPTLRGLWQWGQIATRFDRGPSTAKVMAIRNPGSESPEYRTLREMEFTTLAWTSGTSGPVRAPVVKMPENDEQFEAAKDKVKGAWVLVKPNTAGRRGIGSSASGRMQAFADIRKRWKGGDAATADAAATAAAAAEKDKAITHYDGAVSGGPMPDGMMFTLDVNLTDPKTVTGTISLGGFRTSQLVNATFNPETGELKFRTESARGDRDYTVKLEGDTLKGTTVLPDNGGTITYLGKKVKPEDPKKGPAMEERVLALQPAGWILASSNELVITGGAPGWRDLDLANLSPDIIATVRKSDYDCMNSALADGAPVEAEFNLSSTFTKGPIPVYNTVAEIKGTQWPDEVVIVSGHLDTWNGPGAQGTTDNGTGSAVTLEAARILMAAKAQPKRTIRFVLWTGEEQGLLGAAAYVKHLKEKGQLDKVSTVLVDDGGTNYEGGLACMDSQVPYLAAATAPVNGLFYSATDKKFLDVNIHRQKTFNQVMGSDHAAFIREKVPGFFWDEVGRADYNYTHHTQHDRLDQAIPEYLQQSSTCAAVTAYNLACAPTLLPRPADNEWPRGGRGGAGGAGRPGAAPDAAGTPAAEPGTGAPGTTPPPGTGAPGTR